MYICIYIYGSVSKITTPNYLYESGGNKIVLACSNHTHYGTMCTKAFFFLRHGPALPHGLANILFHWLHEVPIPVGHEVT